MSRGAIEQMLHELTGFKRDSAEIAGALLKLDAYAADMTFALSEAPTPVIESYLHLLYQQSELLLDSGRSIRRLEETGLQLAETVTELSESVRKLADDLSSHDHPYYDRPVADDRFVLTDAERAVVRQTLDAEVREIEAQEIPQWERELLDEQARRQDAEMDQVISDAADEALGVRVAGQGDEEVYCRTCEQWKGSANFFRNTKSKTGYESKCRTCRRAAKAA